MLPEGGERVEAETRTHVLNAAPLVVGKHRARAHGLNARNLRLRDDQCSELAEISPRYSHASTLGTSACDDTSKFRRFGYMLVAPR